MENGRTLVPVRAVSEHLKYSVEWSAEEQRVDIDSPSDKLTLYIGNADYYKNGEKRTMDVPAVIKDERTFVPLRLVAEEMGCEVKWDEENNIANIIKYNIAEAKTPHDIILNAASYTKIILKEQEYDLSELDAINIDKCGLYGCGTYGITATDSAGITVENTEIYECTYGLVELSGCDGIKFNGCTFRDSGMFSMFVLDGCSGVSVTNSKIKNNNSSENSYFISAYDCSDIEFSGCDFSNNFYYNFCSGDAVKFIGCKL